MKPASGLASNITAPATSWAVAKRPMGVCRRICSRTDSGVDALARVCCTAPETQALQALDADARQHAFLRLWTRKEAYLKALGLGLSRGPEAIEVGIAPAVACGGQI